MRGEQSNRFLCELLPQVQSVQKMSCLISFSHKKEGLMSGEAERDTSPPTQPAPRDTRRQTPHVVLQDQSRSACSSCREPAGHRPQSGEVRGISHVTSRQSVHPGTPRPPSVTLAPACQQVSLQCHCLDGGQGRAGPMLT